MDCPVKRRVTWHCIYNPEFAELKHKYSHMQTIKAYVGENIILAYMVGYGNVGQNEATIMYSNPIKLYTGVENPIKLRCLNSDQQAIDVSNVSIQVGLFEPETGNQLISLTTGNYDSANGLVITTFTASTLANLPVGFYELACTASDNSGNVWPLYIDDQQGSRLQAQLLIGPVFAYNNPTPVTFIDLSGVGVVSNQIDLTTRPMGSTTATLAANLIAYTGNIVAQGSLVSAPTNLDWANISYVSYANISGPIMQSVSGSFATLRFLLDTADPTGNGNVAANSFITSGNIRI